METTRHANRVTVSRHWNQSRLPFEELRQMHRNTRSMADRILTSNDSPRSTSSASAGFVGFLELARLRCQLIDQNIAYG